MRRAPSSSAAMSADAPRGDLARPTPRGGGASRRSTIGHAGAPVGGVAPRRRRAARRGAGRAARPARPASIVARGQVDRHRAKSAARPATTSAAAGVEQHDVAPRPGLAGEDASTIAAFSAGVPPASADVGAPAQPERGGVDASIAERPPVVDVVDARRCRRAAARRRRRRGRRTPDPCRAAGATCGDPRGGGRIPHPDERPRRAPAGFVSGPSRLNAVRTPISRRVGPACSSPGGSSARTGTRTRCSRSAAAGRYGVVVDADAQRLEHVGRAGRATSSRGCRASRPGRRPPRRRARTRSRC